MDELKINALFDLNKTLAKPLLSRFTYPWEALPEIKDFILALGKTLSSEEYDSPSPDVWVAKTAKVAETAFIAPPTIICAGAEVRHCAFIRGSVLVGEGCVVGNSTEIKNAILFDSVQVPHFNYVGDSILGYRSHLGAGAVTSNVKSDKTEVTVLVHGEKIGTGRKKFGAAVGDFTEVGCNSVLNPGTVLGRHCTVYPTSSVRGYIPGHSIHKLDGVVRKRT